MERVLKDISDIVIKKVTAEFAEAKVRRAIDTGVLLNLGTGVEEKRVSLIGQFSDKYEQGVDLQEIEKCLGTIKLKVENAVAEFMGSVGFAPGLPMNGEKTFSNGNQTIKFLVSHNVNTSPDHFSVSFNMG